MLQYGRIFKGGEYKDQTLNPFKGWEEIYISDNIVITTS